MIFLGEHTVCNKNQAEIVATLSVDVVESAISLIRARKQDQKEKKKLEEQAKLIEQMEKAQQERIKIFEFFDKIISNQKAISEGS